MSFYPDGPAVPVTGQRGVALVVALMILIIISVLGITAMRTSLFNAKIATMGQGATMAFQAAESAISAVHSEALDTTNGTIIEDAMMARQLGTGYVQFRCVTESNVRKSGDCTAGTPSDTTDDFFMDSRGIVKASSRTVMKEGVRPVAGAQLSRGGGANTSFAWYDFVTVAKGEVDPLKLEQYNVQEFTRLGLYSGGQY